MPSKESKKCPISKGPLPLDDVLEAAKVMTTKDLITQLFCN